MSAKQVKTRPRERDGGFHSAEQAQEVPEECTPGFTLIWSRRSGD